MNKSENKSVVFATWLSNLRRRWWLLAICLLAMLIPIWFYNQNATPIYRASTKLIFEQNEELLDSKIPSLFEHTSVIMNQIEEMRTASFAQEVYEALPPEKQAEFLRVHQNTTSLTDQEFVVNEVAKNLEFEPTRETEIVDIQFDSPSPDLAGDVANAAAQVLIHRNLDNKRKRHSKVKNIINDQLEIVRQRLQTAEADLKQFKESHNITSLESETQEMLERLTQAEILYNQVSSNKEELRRRGEILQAKLKSEKRGLSESAINTGTPTAARLKEKLVNLEVQYSNLQVQGIPDNHPKMVELRNEIALTKQNLIDATVKINQEDTPDAFIDPFSQMQKYLGETVSNELDLEALTAKEQNLRSLIGDYNRTLQTLPKAEMELARLTRDREVNYSIYMTLLNEHEKARVQEASELGNIRVVETAKLPLEPARPRKTINLVIGMFSGLLLGLFMISGIEYFNNAVKTDEDVTECIGLPVLASIPRLKKGLPVLFHKHGLNGNGHANGNGKGNGKSTQPKKSSDEAILMDEYNLLHFTLLQKIRQPCVIMVTSSIPNEGKSTIATMLALTCAQRGENTLLIDGDLRRPMLHHLFGVSRKPGLTNLAGRIIESMKKNQDHALEARAIDTLLMESLVPTFESNLFLLPAGVIPANPVRAWSSRIWKMMFARLKRLNSIIIIDAPPIIGIPDGSILSLYVDYVLFCVEADGIDKRTLKKAFKSFGNAVDNSEQKITGAVLNKIDLHSQYTKYKYYRYYSKAYPDYNVSGTAEKEYSVREPFGR